MQPDLGQCIFTILYIVNTVQVHKERIRQLCVIFAERVAVFFHCFLKFFTLFKGTVARDFRPLVFSSNSTPGSIDSWAKAVSNIDSYSRR
jgi:hypothetical protein